MDTLTHALVGLAVGALRRPDQGRRRPLSVTDRGVLAASLIGAQLPDIDVFLMPGDSLNHLRFHRGYTHSLVGSLVLAALAALLTRTVFRKARWGPLYVWGLLGVLSHLLADVVTGYGTRVLLPWSNLPVHFDLAALIEPWWTVPLGLCLVFGIFRPVQFRRMAALGLIWSSLFLAMRFAGHRQLMAQLREMYGGPRAPVAMTAHPGLWRWNQWHYVVETEQEIYLGQGTPGSAPAEYAHYRKPGPADPVVRAASQDPTLSEILRSSRHPLLSYRRNGDGIHMHVTDFRGGYAFNFDVTLDSILSVTTARRDFDSYGYVTVE